MNYWWRRDNLHFGGGNVYNLSVEGLLKSPPYFIWQLSSVSQIIGNTQVRLRLGKYYKNNHIHDGFNEKIQLYTVQKNTAS